MDVKDETSSKSENQMSKLDIFFSFFERIQCNGEKCILSNSSKNSEEESSEKSEQTESK